MTRRTTLPNSEPRLSRSYPEHERETRVRGIPAMGSGRVFLLDEEKLLVEPMSIMPASLGKAGRLDFGWDHPAAFVELWWDRDMDFIYLVRTLRLRHKTPLQHVEAVRHWRLRWAWPQMAGNQTLAGAGIALARAVSRRWPRHDARARDVRGWRHSRWRLACRRCTIGCAAVAGRYFKGQNDDWLEEYCHVSPQGWVAGQGRRRRDLGKPLRSDDAPLRPERGGAAHHSTAKFNIQRNGVHMTAPTYITIQLRRPRDDDPGVVDEAWYVVRTAMPSQFTDRYGVPLPGEGNRRELRPNETPREGAARLLRARSRSRPARPFNRPLRYPAVRF